MLNSATVELEETNTDSPGLDAELLLSHVWNAPFRPFSQGKSAVEWIKWSPTLNSAAAFLGCPVAYLTGEKEFWSLTLRSAETL
ncbi:MAG: hypothetical protein CM1200mP30_10450 [Pseudomonadota bacterium]|nr:MAG: hypothetical protein CM1200mP30_10450 [Pseudomonadota bacterium]